MGMRITPELKQQFAILAILNEGDLIGEFLIAIFEQEADLYPDPEDMHPVVNMMFKYWTDPVKYRELFPIREECL